VLWLRDEELQEAPLCRLDWLLRDSDALGINTANVNDPFIGPRTSTTLLSMMHEVAEEEQPRDYLPRSGNCGCHCHRSDELLLHEINKTKIRTIEKVFR